MRSSRLRSSDTSGGYPRAVGRGSPGYGPAQRDSPWWTPPGTTSSWFKETSPEDLDYGGAAHLKGLAKALDNARILHDFKNDDAAACRALTSALRRPKEGDTDLDRARALAFMIELAPTAGAGNRIDQLVNDMRALHLSPGSRST